MLSFHVTIDCDGLFVIIPVESVDAKAAEKKAKAEAKKQGKYHFIDVCSVIQGA